MPPIAKSLLFISLLLLSSSLTHSYFSNYHTLFSLSHSLISRVAALRTARGDVEGAARARALARNFERGMGLGFYKYAWNVGWDYMKNYAWNGATSFQDLRGVVSDLNELLGILRGLNRVRSDAERVAWLRRSYRNALRVSKSLFSRLLNVFRRSMAKTRRHWSDEDKIALIDALKLSIIKGWRGENGFRTGHLIYLEEQMKAAIPGIIINPDPHIRSMLHMWKREYGFLSGILSKSGVNWNSIQKKVECTKELWDEESKVAKNPSGEDINALEQHIKNLMSPSSPFSFSFWRWSLIVVIVCFSYCL